MKKYSNHLKIIAGLLISALFLFMAFRKIDLQEMKHSFATANYIYFLPAVLAMFLSHWLRSLRWQYFLNPIKKISVNNLFSATMIGYMGNSILPAHLGELVRAYVIGKKQNISTSSTLATIVIERIVDLFSLLVIMAASLIFYPFPGWVKQSGYIMFAATIFLFLFLVILKKNTEKTLSLLRKLLKFLPEKLYDKIEQIIYAFINGITGLKSKTDYLMVIVTSILIWFGYWLFLHINFYTFNLFELYHVNAISSLVLLVITTISIVVPSSPGYVGTYHLLCQLALGLFGVSRSVGLSFAIVVHAINLLPVIIVGILFAWKEGINLNKISKNKDIVQTEMAS